MNATLWAGQIALAGLFLLSGLMKSLQSRERLRATNQTGVMEQPMPLVRLIGISELLGVVGLIVPWATGIEPVLTPVAAIALGVIMLLAAGVHLERKEPKNVVVNILVLAVCVLVAWGRLR